MGSGAKRRARRRGSACPTDAVQSHHASSHEQGAQDKVISLTGRLPQIWGDEAISDAHRKALLRCLIEKVVLDRGEHDLALARIVWELEVKMSVNSVTELTRGTEMRERSLALARDGVPDDEIAAILTQEGHRSPRCADKVLPITVAERVVHATVQPKAVAHPTDARSCRIEQSLFWSGSSIVTVCRCPMGSFGLALDHGSFSFSATARCDRRLAGACLQSTDTASLPRNQPRLPSEPIRTAALACGGRARD